MIPGLVTIASGVTVLSGTLSNPDVFALAGSPASAGTFRFLVATDALVQSSDPANPAIDFTTFPSGSTIDLTVVGDVRGAGGAGGLDGRVDGGVSSDIGGGGGGGAGQVVGVGYVSADAGTSGDDGTATAGGAGGTRDAAVSGSFATRNPGEGGDGGDAIESGAITLNIRNSGTIWGGGGGGGGGTATVTGQGGTGGAPGAAGAGGVDDTAPTLGSTVNGGGAAGYAVRGSAVTFLSGSGDPNVKGTVGT